MVGQWLGLSGVDSQSALCGVDISSQCLRGELWGGWLSKFNCSLGRIIAESKNTIKPAVAFSGFIFILKSETIENVLHEWSQP